MEGGRDGGEGERREVSLDFSNGGREASDTCWPGVLADGKGMKKKCDSHVQCIQPLWVCKP